MKKIIFPIIVLLLFFTNTAFSAPPAPPMIIHGEALIDGAVVPAETIVKIQAGQFQIESSTVLTETGISYYTIIIPQDSSEGTASNGASSGDSVQFITIGDESLSEISPVNWESGKSLKQDIVVRPALSSSSAPEIVSASADSSGTGLSLNSSFNPAAVENTELSHRLRWYLRNPDADKPEDETILIKEDTLTQVTGEKQTTYTIENAGDLKYLELIITPLLTDGKIGASAYKKVIPVISEGTL